MKYYYKHATVLLYKCTMELSRRGYLCGQRVFNDLGQPSIIIILHSWIIINLPAPPVQAPSRWYVVRCIPDNGYQLGMLTLMFHSFKLSVQSSGT